MMRLARGSRPRQPSTRLVSRGTEAKGVPADKHSAVSRERSIPSRRPTAASASPSHQRCYGTPRLTIVAIALFGLLAARLAWRYL
jgi:hypothetical protein